MSARLKLVLRGPSPFEDRRVDRLQHEVVLWAREIQESEAIDMALILGRNCDLVQSDVSILHVWGGGGGAGERQTPRRLVPWRKMTYPMDCGLDVTPREETQRITGVHGQAAIERLGPFPVARLVVLDLEAGDRLPEEQRDRAQVRVAVGSDAVLELADLLRRER